MFRYLNYTRAVQIGPNYTTNDNIMIVALGHSNVEHFSGCSFILMSKVYFKCYIKLSTNEKQNMLKLMDKKILTLLGLLLFLTGPIVL